jgi:hypothetical protein
MSNHRERKSGASREAWQKRKAELNAARPKQTVEKFEHHPGALLPSYRRFRD